MCMWQTPGSGICIINSCCKIILKRKKKRYFLNLTRKKGIFILTEYLRIWWEKDTKGNNTFMIMKLWYWWLHIKLLSWFTARNENKKKEYVILLSLMNNAIMEYVIFFYIYGELLWKNMDIFMGLIWHIV